MRGRKAALCITFETTITYIIRRIVASYGVVWLCTEQKRGKILRNQEKTRTAFWIENELLARCDNCWKNFGFASRNEFVNRAIKSYVADQTLKHSDGIFSEKLAAAIAKATDDGMVKISKGLFRYAVEQEMIMHMLAEVLNFTGDEIWHMRGEAIKNVQKTKGKISLEAIADFRRRDDEKHNKFT